MSISRKTTVLFCAVSLSLLTLAYCDKPKSSGPVELKTQSDSISYMIGFDIGKSLKQFQSDIRYDQLFRGIRDHIEGQEPKLTAETMQALGQAFSQRLQEQQMKKMTEDGSANTKKEEEFLAKNKSEPGVVTTASGLQYSVVKKGAGAMPKPTDQVTVHYKGTTLAGKEFDSSYKRGQPASFQLNGVIPGWTEGLQLMGVGSQFKFWIPSKLAYGQRSPSPDIGPNELLIFEVELLAVNGKPEIKSN